MEKLDTLKAEQNRLRQRLENDRKRFSELGDRIRLLEKREQLQRMVDIRDGVTIGWAERANLRGKPATVKKVNRCRALVEIGGESWDMPFGLLKLEKFDAELELQVNRGLGN